MLRVYKVHVLVTPGNPGIIVASTPTASMATTWLDASTALCQHTTLSPQLWRCIAVPLVYQMGHALTTLLEQGGEGLGNPGALDLALFSLEHGSQVSSALAAVCLAASRDSRAILSG